MKIKDLNISELKKYSKETLNKIRREILLDNELIEIPSILLPDVFDSSYYFVSYSHNDFRLVYKDIISLEENGLNIWYDKGIPAGKHWKKTMNDFMFPNECRGVIFYLSENSLLSNAVIDEIEYAKKAKKTIIIIMLPFERDFIYQNESTLGKYYSAHTMANILKENGFDISDTKLNDINELIPDELLYLALNMDSSTKAEKISNSAPDIPDFEIAFNDAPFYDGKDELVFLKLNNYKIDEINDSHLPLDELKSNKIRFSTGVCANAQLLESINFSGKYRISVGHFAFYGCKSLKDIKLGSSEYETIGEYAFSNCSSIKEVDIHGHCLINKRAFSRCNSLRKVIFNDRWQKIMDYAFANNENLETVDLCHALEVRDCAFGNCPKLKNVIFSSEAHYMGAVFENNYGITEINLNLQDGRLEEYVFSRMHGLKKAEIVVNEKVQALSNVPGDLFFSCENLETVKMIFKFKLNSIDDYAFASCFNLKNVEFDLKPKKIKYKAFDECKNLDTLFSSEKGTIDLTEITSVEPCAFSGCNFKKLIIGKCTKTIGDYAFGECQNLEEIYIQNEKINERILLSILSKNASLKSIYFCGSIQEFKSKTEPDFDNGLFVDVFCNNGNTIIKIKN